jgi:peptidoglycan-N-acetylglucosamine deacetylase
MNVTRTLNAFRIGILLVSSLIVTTVSSNAQQIAITFDDAPLGDGPLFSGAERTSRIINTLKKHRVSQAAFFVVTGYIDSTNVQRLRSYSNAGHALANHSHTHSWIRNIGTASYIRDIQKADSILKKNFSPKPWYRYPYLDEGRTTGSRDSIRIALDQLQLKNGYVTIDNYDWYLNGAFRKALEKKAKINYDVLKEIYLDHIWQSIQFYDAIGQKVLNRSPRHVLLLHENDMAALFLDDLLQLLHKKGWMIIRAEDAFTDPIAAQVPDVLFNGQGRVGAIAYSKGMKPIELIQQSEDEEFLDRLLESKKAFVY